MSSLLRALPLTLRLLALLALAYLIRWPLSVYVHALSLDPNTPLHTLVLQNLEHYGAFSPVRALDFPSGQPVQVVGVPLLLLSRLLALALPPIAALNAGVVGLLFLQGLATSLAAAALGMRARGQLAAGAASMLAPYVLHVSGNGQFENIAAPGLAMVCAAGLSSPLVAGLGGAAGLLWAGFSSPYQTVPAGILLLCCAALTGRRNLAAALVASALSAGVIVASYQEAISQARSEELELLSPPSHGGAAGEELIHLDARSGRDASSGLLDLAVPRAVYFGRSFTFPGAETRLERLERVPVEVAAGRRWRYIDTPQMSYQGAALGVAGLVGLLWSWRERWARAALLAGLLCAALAMGPSFSLWTGQAGLFPLPWALLERLPFLGELSATYRFLSGVSFALALGVGGLASRAHLGLSPLLVVALAADGLLRAPVYWPLISAYPRLDLPRFLELKSPVAIWPCAEILPGHWLEGMVLVMGQPAAVFRRDGEETPEEWLARLRGEGVNLFVALEEIGACDPWSPPETGAPKRCAAGACWHEMKETTEDTPDL